MLKKFLALVISVVLLAAAVITLGSCSEDERDNDDIGAPQIEQDESNSDGDYKSDDSTVID